MKHIINFCLNNKFAIWLMTLIVACAGIYAGTNMKLETIPNINTPVIMISTTYTGATPQEIEDKVTAPIEQGIKNLSGVQNVTTTSTQNNSSIQIEYDYSTDMDQAKNDIKEALDKVDLPDNVDKPTVSRVSLNDFPILSLSITDKNKSFVDLTKTIENDIVPQLQSIDGVSQVQASGQYVQEVQLAFKQDKLNALGLDENTVQQQIQASNVSVPLGLINFGKKDKSVVIDGNVKSLDHFKNLAISYTPKTQASAGSTAALSGQASKQATGIPTVKLKDIADIKVVGKHETISKTNGKDSIGITITKAADANTVDVANAVNKKIDKFEKDYNGLKVTKILDQATPIVDSVKTMLEKAIIGAIFAVIIILLFLRNFRSTIIAVISIPMSIFIAFILLKQMDITLNIMTLGAMTVAIGRVIDDSIVVIENIYRRLTNPAEKLKGKELIREATNEVFKPIMSSTIVTVIVFIPLGLVKGMVGELFMPFALTLVFSLLASLLIALTVVPMFAHSLFKNGIKLKKVENHREHGKLASFYKKVLNWSLNHKLITFGLACLLLVGSLALTPLIGASFMSDDTQKVVYATYSPDPGQTLGDVKKTAAKAEDYLLKHKGVKTVQYSIGSSAFSTQDNSAVFVVEYKDSTKNFDKEPDKVIKAMQKMSKHGTWKSQDFGSTSSNDLTMYVYGDNMDEIKPVVNKIEHIMKQNHDLKNVETSLSKTYDEYALVADQNKLSKLGLTAGQLGTGLSQAGNQQVLTTVKKDGKELNVYVQTNKESYKNINELTNTKVTTSLGNKVALKDVVSVKKTTTPNSVEKRNGKIYASVTGKITSSDVSKVTQSVKGKVDKLDVPKYIDISTGGVSEDMKDSFTKLGLAMLAAIAIVYLVLVITFGGALAPFTILFSLPFAVIGALVALYLAHETISVTAMIGALMLIGIVVTNAIVLVDRVIHKENEGLSTREALLEAGATRLRPILMTAIATIFALLPLALGYGGGGLISKGLGVTVIGGLASSTLLTLLIVPVVYEFLMKFTKKKKTINE
ncbi:efflux RND transporter permease subunit [Heyndrickxia ginsengihumi]|uniref:Efflux RND transporter permease subunit n=1 Tax=Heyndrickxia ginsengihumi TaxID=363870 RepID=A0A6M0P7J4_9BACI|nr:efflux RND transporter permease subunit [Heyndrickxia ginsengihumi]MBE6182994.1 efflux RND transporter permease subunit [Bacillus sp. (in: firmicutes)]MCM3023306.1 efflux RND transporter permease subunit [Heyndrickxia ginsengihumi]NEY19248.1 efflux RND transporter permease subunit [Heyndrickxia ginsengihumi]